MKRVLLQGRGIETRSSLGSLPLRSFCDAKMQERSTGRKKYFLKITAKLWWSWSYVSFHSLVVWPEIQIYVDFCSEKEMRIICSRELKWGNRLSHVYCEQGLRCLSVEWWGANESGWLRAMLMIGKERGLFKCPIEHAFFMSFVNFNHITFSFHLL